MTDHADAENMFKTALAAAHAAKFNEALKTDDGRQFLLTPSGFGVKEITDPAWLDPHPSAAVVVDEKAALTDYVVRFREPGTVLFADVDCGAIKAVIDYHLASGFVDVKTGAARHSATLVLRKSEEFARWDEFEGDLHSQAEFARFLEENAVDILFPDQATMIEIARDLSATEGVKFASKVDLQNGNRRFHYENETKVDGDIAVPSRFTVNIPLYAGEEPIELEALFRYRVAPAGLMLGFEWRRVEYLKLAHFKQIAFAVAEATGAPVFLGRWK